MTRLAQEAITAIRIATSRHAWVERLGEDVLISYQRAEALPSLQEELAQWSASAGFSARRVFGRFLPRQNEDRSTPVFLTGAEGLPLQTTAQEAGLNFDIDFSAGYSTGLFIDQRANRALVRRLAPRRLLNTFAYTCSFSVVAASTGAQTVSVDLSKKSLDRGRINFGLNGLPQDQHQFIADDVLDVLPRLARRGEKFDVIILDPPTFSRGNRGRRFQVEEQMENLIVAAMEVAEQSARILISTNCTRLGVRDLEWMARGILKQLRRGGDLHREPDLPDIPSDVAARTIWLTLR